MSFRRMKYLLRPSCFLFASFKELQHALVGRPRRQRRAWSGGREEEKQIADMSGLSRAKATYARSPTFPPYVPTSGRTLASMAVRVGGIAGGRAGERRGGGDGGERGCAAPRDGAGGACPGGDAAPRRRPPVGLLCDDHPARHRHASAGPAGRPSSPARPRCVGMRRTTRGSSIVAIRRMRPPQFGQASTSTAKTLWSSSAQRQRLGGAARDGGSAGSGVTAPGPEAAKGTPAAAG